MPYYKTCSDCGANLDPGERCDCRREQNIIDISVPVAGGASLPERDALEEYAQYLSLAGFSPSTITTYIPKLAALSDYLTRMFQGTLRTTGGICSVAANQLLAFYESLVATEKKRNTLNLYAAAIREFFKRQVVIGRRTDNPALALPHARRRYGEVDTKLEEDLFYSMEDARIILRYLQSFMQKISKKRDLALFVLMCASGLRISEACSLNVRDMETIREGYVKVIGKGGRLEKAGIGAFAIPFLEAYLEARGAADGDAPLFVSQKGGRLTRNAAWKAFKRFWDACGIRGKGTHGCRHLFITIVAYVSGMVAARGAARHKQTATTERYVHALDAAVASAINEDTLADVFADELKSAS